jgi:uncharacterized protein
VAEPVSGGAMPRAYTEIVTFNLRTLKLAHGEQFRDTTRVELEPFALGGESYEPTSPAVEATLTVTRMASGLVFRLELATELTGPCMRCLGVARVPVRVDATEVHEPGEAEELQSAYVESDRLDVGQWARDAVALELPEQIVCRPDCAGICPECGKDLNREPHTHEHADLDPRWAGLAELRDSL